MVTLTLVSSGPADTAAIAEAVAPLLTQGDVVALSGELGAGKTRFVQGAAQGLGITERVTSPTFVLMRHYEGRLSMVHVDVYRLDRLHDVDDLGDDVLAPDVVTFLEWSDAVESLLPEDRLDVEITVPVDLEAPRTVTLRGAGQTWRERADMLTNATAPWRADNEAP